MGRTREITSTDLLVDYVEVKDRVDHSFGSKQSISYEITKIEAYIPALESWLDVTHMHEFTDAANKLLHKEIEGL